MCSRGIYQLKKLNIWFCNSSGSSQGIRKFLESQELQKFMDSNKQIEFNFLMKKNQHPYVESGYINGYRKDISLKNLSDFDMIIDKLNYLRTTDGAKPIPHAGKKVFSSKPSIQGGWRENMWDQYPKHEMEIMKRFEEPQFTYKRVPVIRPSENERRNPDLVRRFVKSKRYYYEGQESL